MSESIQNITIDQIEKKMDDPLWIAKLRHDAIKQYKNLPWPNPSDDIWRRTNLKLMDPFNGFNLVLPCNEPLPSNLLKHGYFTKPLGEEDLFVRINGSWAKTKSDTKDIFIGDLSKADGERADRARNAITSDGLTPGEKKLSSLNRAFHNDDVLIDIPKGFVSERPIRILHVFSAKAHDASFPMTVVLAGENSSVTLIDEYISISEDNSKAPHLINGHVELVVSPESHIKYVRLQRWEPGAREFLLMRASLYKGADLKMANINLGARISKSHIINRFLGENSSGRLSGFVFGNRDQHIDQHTLQDHKAPNTFSNLQFRAALKDHARAIYTGLIRIEKEAEKTEAYQESRALILSDEAASENIPVLEILADSVQCKHATSVGPIDEGQAFYLMTRGFSHEEAERFIAMGFVESMIKEIPFVPLQERLRYEIENQLNTNGAV